jgi:hypothetical protein
MPSSFFRYLSMAAVVQHQGPKSLAADENLLTRSHSLEDDTVSRSILEYVDTPPLRSNAFYQQLEPSAEGEIVAGFVITCVGSLNEFKADNTTQQVWPLQVAGNGIVGSSAKNTFAE